MSTLLCVVLINLILCGHLASNTKHVPLLVQSLQPWPYVSSTTMRGRRDEWSNGWFITVDIHVHADSVQ